MLFNVNMDRRLLSEECEHSKVLAQRNNLALVTYTVVATKIAKNLFSK